MNDDLYCRMSCALPSFRQLGISPEERRRFGSAVLKAPDEDALPEWAKDYMRRAYDEIERLARARAVLAAVSNPVPSPGVWCAHCKWLRRGTTVASGRRRRLTCEAYPDGIPDAITANYVSHTRPHEGDHGLRFVDRRSHRRKGRPRPELSAPQIGD
jgi:hypothetical protein